ncbi:MAG: ectC [Moraxellaceae bacterium]|jgi:L-ectoine synthase|nr:ectC [Moraxellaceae bacterium]
MIVRHFEDILPSSRAVHADNWSSFRLLTRDDGMGFSLHETWIHPGTETHIWYKHHFEAVYCIEGEGEIEPVDAEGRSNGAPIPIKPGMMYALNEHDRHFLRARTRLRLICVFNPPLRGDETHDKDGAYAAPTPESAAQPPGATRATPARSAQASAAAAPHAASGGPRRHLGTSTSPSGRTAPSNTRKLNAT